MGDATSLPGQALTYDPEGKLSTDTTTAGTQTNVYDTTGTLLLQTDPTDGSTLYLGDTELHEAPGSSTVTATRTYSAGSTPIAEQTTASGTDETYSLNADVDGTVDLEVNVNTGAVTRRYADPFGNPLCGTGRARTRTGS
ncbi:MAG: secreted protein [Frondihabitans sp.]|nr:secreted protein [Frondihabitans sp.]